MFINTGARSKLLIKMAYEEEGMALPEIDERKKEITLLYPKSFLEKVKELNSKKIHKYNFVGTLYYHNVYEYRKWILDFAEKNFTDKCVFQITADPQKHKNLGAFDKTGENSDIFVPKETQPSDRAYFHPYFFQLMKSSQFTLCPAGDAPWSMRFTEAIMCGSIPVLEKAEHSGHNALERKIPYRYYLKDDDHKFRADWVRYNRELFLRHHTLIYKKRKKG